MDWAISTAPSVSLGTRQHARAWKLTPHRRRRVYVLLLAALALNVELALGQWPPNSPPPPPAPPNILQEEIRYSDGNIELKGMVVWNNNSIWHSRRGFYGTCAPTPHSTP